jgi:hypothetical protein
VPTLVLSPRHTSDAQALWRAALARGWDVHRLASWRIDDEAASSVEPFLYAEALFGPSLGDGLGVSLLDPSEDWLSTLPERYSRRQITLSTLGAARSLTVPAFIKPPNDKSFAAAIYAPGELPEAFESDMKVLISEPVVFESEFRCFVLDRKVKTFSLYARRGDPCPTGDWTIDESALLAEFTTRLLRDTDVELPRACVLDCGPIEGKGWAAVELNAAWGSGIYSCDPELVLDVVRAATETRKAPPARG